MRNLPSFKVIGIVQAVIAIGGFVWWWLYRTSSYLSKPIGMHDEYYPHNWGFQLIVGGIYLVGWSAAVASLIILEYFILRRIKPDQETGPASRE